MSDHVREMALLRVLAGLAWADGVLQDEERSFLHGLAVEYGVSSSEWEAFSESLRIPVSLEDYESAVLAFKQVAGHGDDADVLLSRAERLVEADQSRGGEELHYLYLLREWLAESKSAAPDDKVPFLGRLKNLLQRKGNVRQGLAAKNLMGDGAATDPQQDYVTLFGALLYRVVYADQVVDAAEAVKLRELLTGKFRFAASQVDYALRLIQKRAAQDLDRQRLCAEFNRMSEPEERIALIEACFEMAKADGDVTTDEEQEIRRVANFLWVEIPDLVEARKRVLGR